MNSRYHHVCVDSEDFVCDAQSASLPLLVSWIAADMSNICSSCVFPSGDTGFLQNL